MKDRIQNLIAWAEVRQKAFSAMIKIFEDGRQKHKAEGHLEENAFFVRQLELLLNEQPEAITDAAHFCKHDVGRSADAASSETQAVGQNEQTKEVCSHKESYYVGTVGSEWCPQCKKWLL